MYYFISVLAALEVIYMSAIHPRFLASIISTDKRISFIGCFIQMFVAGTSGATESYLLAFMAIDRDLAINHPLRYSAIMTMKFCIGLAVIPWIVGTSIMLTESILIANLDFCGPNEIDHFFCDPLALQALACSDSSIINVVRNGLVVIACGVPFFIIIQAYIKIIMTITKIKSSVGKWKAFSTCSSHLIVTSLFYATVSAVYIKTNDNTSKKYLALMFTLISPTLNPFIYTLRNKDVKEALRKSKLLKRILHLLNY
ncbi:hypothetical protein GDO86_016448 [Hymenochirus boettgeri]|uniref:G-protein coupled receptors family 1 profile domain-containing protein n=1 Tax=Hymenochirus boettgeri TaxID=247094 RepID=A0A8T2K0D9_9PIPI|nr:hypothetical protein GDO86_016448 [Hymenochirus boettgeri]